MSDQVPVTKSEEVTNVAPDLSFEDIVAFFTEHSVTGKCPCCGHENWDVLGSISKQELHFTPSIPINNQVENGATRGDGFVFPVVITTCTKCAYIRMHSRNKILDWVHAQKVQAGE